MKVYFDIHPKNMRATGHRRDPFKAHINYQIYQRRNRKEPESEIKAVLKLESATPQISLLPPIFSCTLNFFATRYYVFFESHQISLNF